MNILAIETTERIGAVAAASDRNILMELTLEPSQRTAQSLAPAMKKLLEQVGWKPGDVQLVAVSAGPGSFTGLRIGVTAAKVFAYSVGADILAIDTLEAIAAAAPADVSQLSAAIDAQRGQVVEQRFRRKSDGILEASSPQGLVNIDKWLGNLPPGVAVTGPVLARLIDRLPANVRPLSPEFWSPRASMVARLAVKYRADGRRDDVCAIAPRYSRISAAEERRTMQVS